MAINSWDKVTNDAKPDRLTNALTRAGSETTNLIKRFCFFLNSCERGTPRKTGSFLILSLSTLMILVSTRMVGAKNIDFSTFDSHTAIIFAHQDDDLLWMMPWWAKSTYIVLG